MSSTTAAASHLKTHKTNCERGANFHLASPLFLIPGCTRHTVSSDLKKNRNPLATHHHDSDPSKSAAVHDAQFSVAISCCMVWRSLLVWFTYSYLVMELAQFPSLIIFEDTLLCSGHVMIAFPVGVSEIDQHCTLAQLLLDV